MLKRLNQVIDYLLWVVVISLPLLMSWHDLANVFSPFKFPFFIGFSAVLLLLIAYRNYLQPIQWDKIDSLVVILLLLLWLSTLYSENILLGVLGYDSNIGRYEGALSISSYLIIFHTARHYIRINQLKILLFISLLSLGAIYALFQFFKWDPLVTYYKFPAIVFATIGNPNFVGTFALVLSVFTLGLFVTYKKWYFLLFATLFSSTLMVSETRSAWLAFVLVVLLYMVYLLIKKRSIISLLIYIGLSMGVNYLLILSQPATPKPVSTKAKEIKKQVDVSNEYAGSGRLKIWEISLGVIKDHPILGCGPEQLKSTLKNEKKEQYIEYKKYKGNTIDRAHNEYLQYAINSGLPYLAVYIILLFLIVVNAMRNIKRTSFIEISVFVVIAYLIQAFFNISVIAVAPMFWMFLGILAIREPDFERSFQELKNEDIAK